MTGPRFNNANISYKTHPKRVVSGIQRWKAPIEPGQFLAQRMLSLRHAFAGGTMRTLFASLFTCSLLVGPDALAHKNHSPRMEKNVEAFLGSRGLGLGLVTGGGNMIEAHYDPETRPDKSGAKYSRLGLSYKSFFRNAFYTRIGFEGDIPASESDRELDSHRELAKPNTGVGYALAGVGHHWHWGLLTFGVDWAEVRTPVAFFARKTTGIDSKPTREIGDVDVRFLQIYGGIAF
jgi:hypothetical protein